MSSTFTNFVISVIKLVITCYGYNTGTMKSQELALDVHSPIPLYYQLKNLLEEQIASGVYKPGDMIPSENKLCDIFAISRTTVRQAIHELTNSGKLTRTQGRGTFVSESYIEKPVDKLFGFTQDMKESGQIPHSKVIQFAPLIPAKHVRADLNLEENEAAIIFSRLRFAGEKVLGLATSYLPFKRFYKFLDENMEDKSLYITLESKYGTFPIRSIYNIETQRCPREIAKLLQIVPGDPVLFLQEVVYDQNDAPFEFVEEFYRADRFAFRVEIRRHQNESIRGIPLQD